MADQKDPAELARLQSQKRQLEEQERSCASTASDAKEKIKRLKKARDEIAECKSSIGSLAIGGYDMNDSAFSDPMGFSTDRWDGDVRGNYETMRSDSLLESLSTYYDRLDDIQDDMNNKIRDLQNSMYANEGIWGDIKTAINNIATKIQNWGN